MALIALPQTAERAGAGPVGRIVHSPIILHTGSWGRAYGLLGHMRRAWRAKRVLKGPLVGGAALQDALAIIAEVLAQLSGLRGHPSELHVARQLQRHLPGAGTGARICIGGRPALPCPSAQHGRTVAGRRLVSRKCAFSSRSLDSLMALP